MKTYKFFLVMALTLSCINASPEVPQNPEELQVHNIAMKKIFTELQDVKPGGVAVLIVLYTKKGNRDEIHAECAIANKYPGIPRWLSPERLKRITQPLVEIGMIKKGNFHTFRFTKNKGDSAWNIERDIKPASPEDIKKFGPVSYPSAI